MSTGSLATVLFAFVLSPLSSAGWLLLAALVLRMRPKVRHWIPGWVTGAAGGGLVALAGHDWAFASGAAASLLTALAFWWYRRRRRRRSLASLGAKSRARIDAMVKRMRERSVPRLTPRPVPEGAAFRD